MPIDARLLVVDPQNDFMGHDDGSSYKVKIGDQELESALPVAGALSDMGRAVKMVDRLRDEIAAIHCTMCAHHRIDVGHPLFWRNPAGQSPRPYTMITRADIMEGEWYPRDPLLLQEMIEYADALETKSQYKITVWPEHCVIGTWGQCVQTDLAVAFERWEHAHCTNIDYILKGTNPRREHYGALMAEVVDPLDIGTQLNVALLQELKRSTGPIGVLGEASSHCILATLRQIADHIGGDEHLRRFYILVDCMSPVAAVPDGLNFPEIATKFLGEMTQRGMNMITSDEFLR